MKRLQETALYVLMVGLIAGNFALLAAKKKTTEACQETLQSSARSRLESRYTSEEEDLLLGGSFPEIAELSPQALGRVDQAPPSPTAVDFVLAFSVRSCLNCIKAEVDALNGLYLGRSPAVRSVTGYLVEEDHERADRMIAYLGPAFPIARHNLLTAVEGATAPVVFVVRSADRRILDVHKPIPEDLKKRDAFYAKWQRLLGLEVGSDQLAEAGPAPDECAV